MLKNTRLQSISKYSVQPKEDTKTPEDTEKSIPASGIMFRCTGGFEKCLV
jgi:hypothetical protein